MKKTKMILILSTIAICGTASIIYYFYRRNKSLLQEVKKLKRDVWCEKNRITESDTVAREKGNGEESITKSVSKESLHSLRNEINNLEDMISSSEDDDSEYSSDDVDSEALLKDILEGDPAFENNIDVIHTNEVEVNPLHSYHLDENDDNDNLELDELMKADTNENIESLVQANISKAVVNIAPSQSKNTTKTETFEDIQSESSLSTVNSDIIEISNMSSQSSAISDILTLEMKINILTDKYTKKNLEVLCSEEKVSKSGSKRVLIKRLLDNNHNFNLNKITEKTQNIISP